MSNEAAPVLPPTTRFAGKFRPPMFDLSIAPVRIGGAGTIEVTDAGIEVSGLRSTGGAANTLMLLPVGVGLCWYLVHTLTSWGISTFDAVINLGGIFVALFVVAALVMKPLVLWWRPMTRRFEWRDVQLVEPHPKAHKPLVIRVVDGYQRRRIYFNTTGPAYELEAAITKNANYTPVASF